MIGALGTDAHGASADFPGSASPSELLAEGWEFFGEGKAEPVAPSMSSNNGSYPSDLLSASIGLLGGGSAAETSASVV